jgi:hypothetical protein
MTHKHTRDQGEGLLSAAESYKAALEFLAQGKTWAADGTVWTGFDKEDVMEFARRILESQP